MATVNEPGSTSGERRRSSDRSILHRASVSPGINVGHMLTTLSAIITGVVYVVTSDGAMRQQIALNEQQIAVVAEQQAEEDDELQEDVREVKEEVRDLRDDIETQGAELNRKLDRLIEREIERSRTRSQ